jgi:hypothetical protein
LFRSSATPRGVAEERPRLPQPVRQQIVALKQANRGWGVRRIAQVLRRWFFMQASPETVRRTLHKEELIAPAPRRPKRNPSKPRFFERAMLRALENQLRLEDTSVLNPRLRKIMERGRRVPEDRLGRRLVQIQQERDNNPPV